MSTGSCGLFSNNMLSATPSDTTRGKPLLVYLAPPDDDTLLNKILVAQDTQSDVVLTRLSCDYVCYKVSEGTKEYEEFQSMFPSAAAPSFMIIYEQKVQGVFTSEDATDSFLSFLDVRSGFASTESTNNDDSNEFKSKIKLSIRLLNGETVHGEFDANHSLKHVSRWLKSEKGVHLSPQDGETMPSYVHRGLPKPSRYAFFCPGTRVTFSEGQEFCRLKALGLGPRSVLILKPEYDTQALEAEANYGTLKAIRSKASSMLHALYSFFDYGVDDAQHDFHTLTNQTEVEDLMQPIPGFLSVDSSSQIPNAIVKPQPDVAEEKVSDLVDTIDYTVDGSNTKQGTPAPGVSDAFS
ncbi:hypothetical protein FOB63_000059 [Clavispora lusitaniae]|uniref:uncharacterized protein n=1 Tax=Clavispora lusitaniae TaxID=36911 RepID=UPI00202C33D8|nr:hypothetical protein FOB63_000059 [Clavispora lusitaniae]